MRRLVLVTALLALTACGSAADPVTLEPSADAGCEATASCEFDPDVPVLQLSSVCYGACGFIDPLGLPDVVLYGDGRVVRTSHDLPDPRPVLTTGQATAEQVHTLVRLAREAELTGGGRSGPTTEETAGLADGGAAVLTARLDGTTTTIESALLFGLQDPTREEPDQRQKLRVLGEALQALTATAPFDEAGVVLRSEPSPYDYGEAAAWKGPVLSGLPADGEARCAILDGETARATLAAVAQDAFPSVYEEGGEQFRVQARPTLPHELTCADVAETVRLVTSERAVTF